MSLITSKLFTVAGAAAVAGAGFLSGFLAGYQTARPKDMIEISWTKECTPDYYPSFAGCRAVIREFDQYGNVQLTFERGMDDTISAIFE